jgi:hypothetical protein
MAATAIASARLRAATPLRIERAARPLRRSAAALRQSPPRRQGAWRLPAVTFALKLLASALAGGAITLVLWHGGWSPFAPHASNTDSFGTAYYPSRQETRIYRNAPPPDRGSDAIQSEVTRGLPLNFPRRVQTMRFTPPAGPTRSSGDANALAGKPLRYLIGASSSGPGHDDEVTVVSYTASTPVRHGISIAYCNLFDETNSGKYGPYLKTSDTAAQYNEGQIDPGGPGWEKNLREQFERRKRQGFEYIELDNPDAYAIKDVIGAIDLAATYGLKVIAKNPKLMEGGAASYVAHPNIHGIIVERGAGNPDDMEALRRKAGKPDLPVWFVAFGAGRAWAGTIANAAKRYRGMGVTYSSAGEYGNAIDILPPA